MALNLKARATLDTSSYIAGLNRIAAANSKLSASAAAANAKELSQTEKIRNAKVAQAPAVIAARKAEANAATKAATASRAAAEATRLNLNAQRYLYADMSRMAMRSAVGLSVLPIAAAAAGIAWERDFANVVRTADPIVSESAATVENLRLSLRDMVQTMPTTWGDVTEIATLANQMGIASRETTSFTRAVAMFSATSNVTVDQTATAFGRLRSIVPDIGSDFMGLADSILKVGVNSVATESEIINIVTQISSIAGAAGMGSKDMIGLAGAMASVRVPPELSRGVITRVFGQISRATADGGAALEGFARVAGMSANDFRESWSRDGDTGQAFLNFVEGLRDLGPRAEAELRGLGITSVRDVPVMLRLAMAADSDGNIGGLLRQTMRDAENATGETQRQYTIMAETVGAKLKVVGNNILAFFSEVGRTSLGPLGGILDFVGDKVQDLTNSLDETAKVFGIINLPMTNSELLGMVALLGLAAAGFMAVASAALKMAQGIVAIRSFGTVFGKGGVFGAADSAANRAASSWRAFPGTVITSMGRAERAVRDSSNRMSRYMRNTNNVATGFVGERRTGAAAAAARRQMIQQRAVAASFAVNAESMAGRTANAFNRAGMAVGAAARGMGAAASFAFGPWGLLIGATTLALGAWVNSTRGAATETTHLAEDMARFAETAKGVEAIEGITVSDIFHYEAKPFEDGYRSLTQLKQAAEALRQESRIEVTTENARGAAAGNLAAALGNETRITKDYSEAVKTLDGAFQEMVSAGNGASAASLLTKFTGTSEELFDLINQPEAKNMHRFFESAFDMGGVNLTSRNLEKLARGDLPEVQAALLGMAEATNVTQAELEAFDGGAEAFSALAKAVSEAAAQFINYGDAVSAATDENENFSMDKFSSELQKQMDAQNAWAENLKVAGKIGGTEFVDALVAMGTDGEQPLQAIVDNFNKTGGDLNGDWKYWMDQLIASAQEGVGVLGVEIGAARDAMIAVLGDTGLADALAEQFSPEQFSLASKAMQEIGREASLEIARGLSSGKLTVEEAMADLLLAQQATIDVDFDVTRAQLSLATVKQLAEGGVTMMQLDALPTLAKNAIWDVVQTAEGETAFVQLDAESGQAIEEVAYVYDQATGTIAPIKLTGDDTRAINDINSVKNKADNTYGQVKIIGDSSQVEGVLAGLSSRVTYSTHVIRVMQQRFSDDAIRYGAQDGSRFMEKDGGIVSYYADGGIRSQHVAQIAPAGAMRVWAEPETQGEAYIPFARSKRTRSVAILDQVAKRFGYSLTNATNVARFADGGQYMAQVMSRQRFSGITASGNTPGTTLQVGPVTFERGSDQDQFREFSRHVRRVGRGL